ncbi:hypothetical protein GF407_00735 [candidate division KSB1 bacterium]|nr:hypothetical protein [candidate division KSB1 bacterium]
MTTLQHIAFNCKDLEKQEAFYSKHFGFRRARVFNAGKEDEFIMLRLGTACIELFSASSEAKNSSGGVQPVGFSHLALEVEDIQAMVNALEADGIQTEGIIDCSEHVEGLRVCFFHDPEGNRIEIMQGWKDQF